MKLGVELNIDVTKIEKARLYKGKKGTYLTMTVFVDPDNTDQYDNNGMITHKKSEGEERAPILGNCKVFWKDQQDTPTRNAAGYTSNQPVPAPEMDNFDDLDIPF